MNIILITAVFALVLAFSLGTALGFFKKIFAVEEDPLIGQIRGFLPGANCGACGFPGCDGYAAAVAKGEAEINKCTVGGQTAANGLSSLVGGSAAVVPVIAVMACRGTHEKAKLKGEYIGVKSCRAAKISTGSIKLCSWGCQGFGDCVKVCKFDALSMGGDGIPHVDAAKCTGCKACSNECPQHIIWAIPREQKGARPLCSNLNVNKAMVAKNCKNGCIKCELCVKNCPEQCIRMANGIPVVDYSKCTSCGNCVAKCPIKVMVMTP
ncbi:MAG: RnfABCDGE type electron transport complex subunit B [Treponema sp.]|nr:RnfABCDGE type electron transport complex subunit B [Treponema sp.]